MFPVAYNYLGIAIRMAYSIGINGRPSHTMAAVIDSQSALRTWWMLYSLESDICLEYGKPLCIRETDAKAPYPQQPLVRMPCIHWTESSLITSRIPSQTLASLASLLPTQSLAELFAKSLIWWVAWLMRGEYLLISSNRFRTSVRSDIP